MISSYNTVDTVQKCCIIEVEGTRNMKLFDQKYIIIKAIRRAKKLTQEEFGKRVGVSRDTITAIELDRVKNVQDVFFEHICNVFHVDPQWLSTGEGATFIEAHSNVEEAVQLFETLDPILQQVALRQVQELLRLQEKQKEPPEDQ